jgi:N-acyl-L-homoserine lactone synthetase
MNTDVLTGEISTTERQFTIELVHTSRQLREVFRLRHQVYCVERGYEPGDGGEETDEFDAHSRHVLLRHTSDGEVIGAARLIGPNHTDLGSSFPMQRVCEPQLFRHLPPTTTGEISRFSISKRRREGYAEGMLTRLALMRGIAQLSSEMGLTHWLALMERGLLRLQKRNGIYFEPIGQLVSFHGMRQPTTSEISSVLERLRCEEYPTWNYLTCGGRWYSRNMEIANAA